MLAVRALGFSLAYGTHGGIAIRSPRPSVAGRMHAVRALGAFTPAREAHGGIASLGAPAPHGAHMRWW